LFASRLISPPASAFIDKKKKRRGPPGASARPGRGGVPVAIWRRVHIRRRRLEATRTDGRPRRAFQLAQCVEQLDRRRRRGDLERSTDGRRRRR